MTTSIPRAFLRFLLLLIDNKDGLPASKAGKSWNLTPFTVCGAVIEKRVGAGRRLVGDSSLIRDVLRTHYNIQSLELALGDSLDASATKGAIALSAGHTKAMGARAARRMSIRCSGSKPIDLFYGDDKTIIIPYQPGVYLDCLESFIDGNTFLKTTKTIAVICENEENFHLLTKASLQKLGVDDTDVACLLFWRSSRIDLINKFIQPLNLSNVYYYGDFDLGGVSIFESEVLPIIPRAELVIPASLQEWLHAYGSPDLYYEQLNKYRGFQPKTESGQCVATLVREAKKALEQETVDELLR